MTPEAEKRLRATVDEFADALLAALNESAPAEAERLLSVDEAAKLVGIGRTALYRELGGGRIRSVRVGRRRLVPQSAIAELAQQ